jgi:hypothetical protein
MSFVVTPCRKAPSMSNVATWRFSAAKIEPTACIETSWPQQVTCHSFFILKINETETSYYFTFVFDIIILGQGPYPFVMQLIHLFHKTKASVPYIASLLWELTSLWVRLDCCRGRHTCLASHSDSVSDYRWVGSVIISLLNMLSHPLYFAL